MRVWNDWAELPVFRDPVVTVGSFDGVHRGHRHLLDVLRRRAEDSGGESVAVTFAEHPRRVLEGGSRRRNVACGARTMARGISPQADNLSEELLILTTPEEKAALIAEAGVDNLVVMPFDERVARMPAEEFVRDFLVARLGVRELVVGYNHRLGCGREGDAGVLRALGEKYGFGVFEASRFSEGEKISSTAIREAIRRGDIEAAERMLGRALGPAGR